MFRLPNRISWIQGSLALLIILILLFLVVAPSARADLSSSFLQYFTHLAAQTGITCQAHGNSTCRLVTSITLSQNLNPLTPNPSTGELL
ncbi:MAG TPA: hypothetical protein VFG52_09125 [Xanthomonadales bacterium]|nr:hypothetical protein [Xanthomonadales bacterium]